jgi:N6-adenosine-specific RNA methylase IME4
MSTHLTEEYWFDSSINEKDTNQQNLSEPDNDIVVSFNPFSKDSIINLNTTDLEESLKSILFDFLTNSTLHKMQAKLQHKGHELISAISLEDFSQGGIDLDDLGNLNKINKLWKNITFTENYNQPTLFDQEDML